VAEQTKPNEQSKQDNKAPIPARAERSLKPFELSDDEMRKLDVSYNVRFLSPAFEEIDAAAYFLRQKLPHVPEELLAECLTDRLNTVGFNKGTTVYVVARKTVGRRRLTEAQGFRETPDGTRITVHPGADKLAEEMGLYGPVKASDHWSESENGWIRQVTRSSFLEALGKIAAPWSILSPDAPGHKNDLPNWVVLQSC
jgi:hypothetical protein